MIHTDRVPSIKGGRPGSRGRSPAGAFVPARTGVRALPTPRSTSRSRARLSRVLLAYFLGIIGVITLTPFQFSIPSAVDVLTTGTWFDVVTNVLLFVPLGFLYPLTRQGENPSALHVFLLGGLLSTTIETVQFFDLDRYTSVLDIVTNASGAGLGALLLGGVNRRIRASPRLVGRLSLEIPLMGLIYLLVPLLLVTSLSVLEQPLRLLSLLALGLLGARLLSAVQVHHFGPAGVVRPRAMTVVAAAWALLGVFPVVLRDPRAGVTLVLVVALAAWFNASRPAILGAERRFEADVLRSATPYVVAYFVATATLPLATGIAPWHFAWGLTGSGGDLSRQMIRLLEPVASIAVLAYMLAEARGRRELPFRRTAARLLAECAGVAAAIEASRGLQRGAGASGIQWALMVGASLVGASIYHSQRERIRSILVHRAPAPGMVVPG